MFDCWISERFNLSAPPLEQHGHAVVHCSVRRPADIHNGQCMDLTTCSKAQVDPGGNWNWTCP